MTCAACQDRQQHKWIFRYRWYACTTMYPSQGQDRNYFKLSQIPTAARTMPTSYKVWSITNKKTKMPRQIMHKSSKLIGLLGKHGWFCFSQPYSTCNSVYQIVRTGRSIFITGNRRRRKNWRVVNKCSRRRQDAWLMRLGFTNSRQHEHVTRYRGDVWVLNRKLTLCSICWVRKVRSWGESISLRLKNWWMLW